MNVTGVEVSVLRAIKVFKVAQGLSDAAADAWAAANLTAGATRFRATMAQRKYRKDPETGKEDAFADLKVWAQSS